MRCYDEHSVLSLETRYSMDSVDSRACLLGKPFPLESTQRDDDLEHIMAHQVRSVESSMSGQRVVLSDNKRRDMQVAELAAKVSRVGRLRFANQDCAPARERRASDIEGFFDRLDRLGVKSLADGQRFVPVVLK
ncbi:hypothetical protein GGH12_000284 [Coemansia sp. RSA 1822]|nr:hypothetical protein LPJ76_005842 [Coemansia sp. RSA 638]KAJ2124747.1 hypothetical protein IW147_001528 [Coemansia sp. RSA 720]KAJ2540657.1 hypothetical protein GGF49_004273 [Coemansia sp. RSA 1853]KAJ2567588.1 hypothetical protein GGH12_000284 [Coemansia sp. RSA 1822]KAJ2666716.1 hypothetical protein IW148_000706 [Coemansia sp. RSA 1199]